MRKIALLSGVATAMLFAAPAFAQEATPPSQPQEQTAPAASTTPTEDQAQPQGEAPTQAQTSGAVQVSPGMTVTGGDGVLGTLVGVQANAEGQQELTVKGADGQVRAVPLSGFKTENGGITVAATMADYQAAAVIPSVGAATAPVGEGDADDSDGAAMDSTQPAVPATPAAPAKAPEEGEDTEVDSDEGDTTPATPTTPAAPPAGEEEGEGDPS